MKAHSRFLRKGKEKNRRKLPRSEAGERGRKGRKERKEQWKRSSKKDRSSRKRKERRGTKENKCGFGFGRAGANGRKIWLTARQMK